MENQFICNPRTAMAKALAILFISFVFTGCATTSPPPPAQVKHTEAIREGVPGGIIVNTVELMAKVTLIDPVSRKVTLLKSDGKKVTVKAGPEVINFDQIRLGDMLKVSLTEELIVFLDSDGISSADGTEGIVVLAPKGAKPGGVMAETTKITATVTDIDPASRLVTLLFDDGSAKVFPVRRDIDLSKHRPGEKVVFLLTEMVAVAIEKE